LKRCYSLTRVFIRLPQFEKQCKHINLDEDDVRAIEIALLDNPASGTIINGTGGIRKFRFPLPNIGKSGGVRVIYVDFAFYEKIYLITAYGKSETEDLTQAERNELKKLIDILLLELKRKG